VLPRTDTVRRCLEVPSGDSVVATACYVALPDSFSSVHNRSGALLSEFYCLYYISRCNALQVLLDCQVSLGRECCAFRVLVPAFLDGRPVSAGYGAVLDEVT
jgi:hypothetical protein